MTQRKMGRGLHLSVCMLILGRQLGLAEDGSMTLPRMAPVSSPSLGPLEAVIPLTAGERGGKGV